MSVRRAAGARWAAKRAEEANAKRSESLDDGLSPHAVSEPHSPHGAETPSMPRRGRMKTAPAAPGFGMMPDAASAMAAAAAYGGMYPNPYAAAMYANPFAAGMYPNPFATGMYPGMPLYAGMPPGVPPFFSGMPPGGLMPPGGVMPMAQNGRSRAPATSGFSGQTSISSRGKTESGSRHGDRSGQEQDLKRRTNRKNTHTSQDDSVGEDVSPSAGQEDNVIRSEALTQVRANGASSNLTLDQVLPFITEFAQDQYGCRFLHDKLENSDANGKQVFMDAFLPMSIKLATTLVGGSFVQKILETGTAERKRALIMTLQHDIVRLSNDMYGCRVVQSAIKEAPTDLQLLIAAELKRDVFSCIQSMHGNHVIQKCIEQMPPDSVEFIIKIIEDRTEEMASHKYGCRVAQRLLEYCKVEQLEKMLEHIMHSLNKLAQDFYGNYVVQHMLQHGREMDKKRIICIVCGNIVTFSKHKFSSNVVEKCFEISSSGEHALVLQDERKALMKAMLGEPGAGGPPVVHQLVDDRFGNHVVQCVMEHARGPEREALAQQLFAAETQLKASTSGKRILACLQKEFVAN